MAKCTHAILDATLDRCGVMLFIVCFTCNQPLLLVDMTTRTGEMMPDDCDEIEINVGGDSE